MMEFDNHRDGHPSRRISVAHAEPPPSRERPVTPGGKPLQRDKKKGGWGWFFVIATGLAVLLGGLTIFGVTHAIHNRHEREETARAVQAGAITVQVVKPSRSPAVFDFSLPGAAEALSTATLYARINGYLKTRLADIGDRVETGQLVAEIDAPDIDAQLNQARAQLELARAAKDIAQVTYNREKQLLDQKVVSRQEFDQNEATLHQAMANVKAGEANVQNLTAQQSFEKITAPFTGVITSRNLDQGGLITGGSGTAGVSLFTEVQSDILRVFIYVPQSYVANVHAGQEVEVTASEYPQNVFQGKVTRTAQALDPTARTMRTEIQLPSVNGKLLPGMYLSIRFKVEQVEPALVVPANAVDIRREGPRVAVVDGQNKLNYRQVKLGRDFGKTVEIVDGLHGDENLVVNPTTDLINGARVEIAKNDDKAKEDTAGGPS